MKLIKLLAIVSLAAGLHATSANAQSIVSNLPGSGLFTGTATNLGLGTDGADRTKAVGVTIGGGLELIFQSMQAIVSNPDAVARLLTGGIYSNVGGNPGTLLAAFNPISVVAGASMINVALTTASPFTLTPGTGYWFVLDGPSVSNGLAWNRDSANTAAVTGLGATLLGYRFSSNGGSTWASSAQFNSMQINVAPVPEPSTWAMIGAGATLLVGFSRARRRS